MSLPSSVGLIGLGLMGGSVARALARLDVRPRVIAWSRDLDDTGAAVAEGVVDEAFDEAAEVAGRAALVVYATPLAATTALLREHASQWRTDVVVTDVASLKTPVVTTAIEVGIADRYVGSHPMAGGESRGYAASRSALFDGARVWITSDTGGPEARSTVDALWHAVGGRTEPVDAASHDASMVWVSHLPQLVSNALARVLQSEGHPRSSLGTGGRDMTRLAASDPTMWGDLLEEGGEAVAAALAAFSTEITSLVSALERGDLEHIARLMRGTQEWSGGGSPS